MTYNAGWIGLKSVPITLAEGNMMAAQFINKKVDS